MKINGIQLGQTVQRGDQMAKKKDRQASAQQAVKNAIAGQQKTQESDRTTIPTSVKEATIVKVGGQPVNQYADSYQSSRPASEAPLRSEKIEHARAMIKNNGYDNPKILEAIIDRLVFALKE